MLAQADCALAVLRLLAVDKGCQPGDDIHNAIIQKWAVEAGLTEAALDLGLSYAGEMGWITTGTLADTTTVTQSGRDHANG